MAETTMRTGNGDITVVRPHTSASSALRAWSAADVLAIDELGDADLGRLLIVNDEFGAISCALAAAQPTVWTDSALSRMAIAANLAANGFPALSDDRSVHGHQQPTGHFDTVVIRIPKTSALLEYQLGVIASLATPQTTILGAGMVRHIHTSTIDAFERLVGATTTSRATRKARLIHTTASMARSSEVTLQASEFVTAAGRRIVELPGTFSAGHLDVGSALLLDIVCNEPSPKDHVIVADLGCGNGILAAEVAARWTNARFELFDVSDLAVEAATRTWNANDLGDRMTAHAADGFGATPSASIDIVITNPPFHQGHALDAEMTDRLLADAARVLRPDGTAFVVAQRHLNLHTRMRSWFGTVDVISKHPSHVVLKATKK